jgi:hypothetical protein
VPDFKKKSAEIVKQLQALAAPAPAAHLQLMALVVAAQSNAHSVVHAQVSLGNFQVAKRIHDLARHLGRIRTNEEPRTCACSALFAVFTSLQHFYYFSSSEIHGQQAPTALAAAQTLLLDVGRTLRVARAQADKPSCDALLDMTQQVISAQSNVVKLLTADPSSIVVDPEETTAMTLFQAKEVQRLLVGAANHSLWTGVTSSMLNDSSIKWSDQGVLLQCNFDCKILKMAGLDAKALVQGGYDPLTLKTSAGLDAKSLIDAGVAPEVLRTVGFTAIALKAAGVKCEVLYAAGYDCLKLKQAAFTAGQLRAVGALAVNMRVAGFDASAMTQGEYLASELRAGGYMARELVDAGVSLDVLKEEAKFDARLLREAGLKATALAKVGFTSREMRLGGYPYPDIREAGFNDASMIEAFVRCTCCHLLQTDYSEKSLQNNHQKTYITIFLDDLFVVPRVSLCKSLGMP